MLHIRNNLNGRPYLESVLFWFSGKCNFNHNDPTVSSETALSLELLMCLSLLKDKYIFINKLRVIML